MKSSEVLERIIYETDAKKAGKGWLGFCPAHLNSNTPALSINQGANGKPLVRCFAGCEQLSVISALKVLGAWYTRGAK